MSARRRDVRIDFPKVNAAAVRALPGLLARWLPGGSRRGNEYVVLNPRRADKRAGSFRVNVSSGKWADFATDDKGRDVVSLYAYLKGIGQAQAAIAIGRAIGIDPYAGRGGPCRRCR